MANYDALKRTIDANITDNGVGAITGPVLNEVLNEMVDVLGDGDTYTGYMGFSNSNASINPSQLPEFDSQRGVATFLNGASGYFWACLNRDNFTILSNGIEIPMTFVGVSNGLFCYVSSEKINSGVIKVEAIYKGLSKSQGERLTITALSYEIEYGDDMPEYSYTANGEVDGTPAITCAATSESGVGVYPIIISQGSVTEQGVIFVNGTLTIKKASVTITADNEQVAVGGTMPSFGVTYSGFKNGEDESVLTTLPTCTTNATDTSTEGFYLIIPDGAVAANYDFVYVAGVLTIGDPSLGSWTSAQINAMAKINGYIDVSVWKTSGTYQGTLIDVSKYRGCTIHFTRSANWTGVRYAVLRSFNNANVTNNQTVAFSQEEGFTTLITNTANQEFDITIPSDAAYLYVYTKSSSTNTAPDIAIKGIPPAEKIVPLVRSLFTANKTIGTDGTIWTGSSAPNNWCTTDMLSVNDVSNLWKSTNILNNMPSGFEDLNMALGLYSASKQWIRRTDYDELPCDFTLTPDVCFVHITMWGGAGGTGVPISSVPIDGDDVQVIGTE